ncbi:glycoside hydrolase family 71 /Carbohydrate-binding module family 24 [Cryphonectria parasitica EP155]|uniref:Glycoside hydrolase family 71 /Carbohydrate-binding module family 24 n=1 Tax=Cryphonectria parasitica (strain ATCC 38755 / EP155) TaxID=660469 RepID=A0A9P5CKG4_CRYP1|nr:glycoside hydrolase family 71 /Carbohydrate-binding module family 24 [Cryphonectria parasitica EP155]KAF3762048.1 glycoside hydrolase family 71 /Carbohydrate-binding module family 24 [Cryphonectria parasitica EP155]
MFSLQKLLVALPLLATTVLSTAQNDGTHALSKRQTTDRYVFCHFMIGIVSDRQSSADYDADMQRAKSLGISAFALNIGVDDFTDTQLNYAYESAANNDMNVFISFDFNWWSTSQGTEIGEVIAQYAGMNAQLMVDDKVFVSSFAGDGVDVAAIRDAAGVDIFFAPNFSPGLADFSTIDAALNWLAWPNNGDNKAPTPGANVTVEDGDNSYIAALGSVDTYIAPVSAWFSTHFGAEVSYSKNWVFPSDLLWYTRWNEILSLGPRFIEVITWNDYGESHYIGPLNSPHYDDGNSKWTNDVPHDGWLDVAKPFIEAFLDGETSADSYVTSDEMVYWYRQNLKSLDCDATDTCTAAGDVNNASGNYFVGKPNGYEDVSDSVFVVAMLTEAGTVTVQSGSQVQEFAAPAGISAYQIDMELGSQKFFLARNGETVLSGQSLKDITDVCNCGIYNFNAYVGTLPESTPLPDQLQPDGLNSLTVSLSVTTCVATPSLGTVTVTPTSTPAVTIGSSVATSSSTTVSQTTSTAQSSSTTSPTVTSTFTTATTTSSTTASATPSGVCISGTGAGNYEGLCSFCCYYGYCPTGVCTCTAYSSTGNTAPATTGTDCIPLSDEDDSYLGLCSYAGNHGYCPNTACQVSS